MNPNSSSNGGDATGANTTTSTPSPENMVALRPPIVRSSLNALNRSLFTKKINLAAAAVNDSRVISKYRKTLSGTREILDVDRISPIVPHPDTTLGKQGKKCILLAPHVKPELPETWSTAIEEGIQKEELSVMPYELELGYDYWSFHDILTSVLPEEYHDDIPGGFNTVGHVAHLNLRDRFLPFKKLIAEVLVDKNPAIQTVINKIDNVGAESQFRTFSYEVLVGKDDLNVKVTESNCTFEFDYSKVYWNSKLETEHRRLIHLFAPGEVVCDVMAGIGPFAVPAGKRGVFVWANDMNPESYRYMKVAIEKNKVSNFVRPFCTDGRTFIHQAADSVLAAHRAGESVTIPSAKTHGAPKDAPRAPAKVVSVPPTIAHFVMNLPASAIEFLGCYRGVYAGHEALFDEGKAKLPMVHVHCFSYKADDETPLNDICERITREIGFTMRPGDPEVEGQVAIHDVRDVAPAKRMFCASFRVPRAVAFAER